MKLNFLNCKPVGQLFIGLVSSVISVTGRIPVKITILISLSLLGWGLCWSQTSFYWPIPEFILCFELYIICWRKCFCTLARSPFVSFLYERGGVRISIEVASLVLMKRYIYLTILIVTSDSIARFTIMILSMYIQYLSLSMWDLQVLQIF